MAPVHLVRDEGAGVGRLPRPHLGRSDLHEHRVALRVMVLQGPRDRVRRRVGRRRFAREAGELLLNGLELRDRPLERDPFARVVDREVEDRLERPRDERGTRRGPEEPRLVAGDRPAADRERRHPLEVEAVEGVPGQRAPLDEAAPGALDERDPVTATATAAVAPVAAAPAITSTRPRDDRDVLRLAPERHPAGAAREGAVLPKPDPVAAADRGGRELPGRDVEPGPGEHEAGDEGVGERGGGRAPAGRAERFEALTHRGARSARLLRHPRRREPGLLERAPEAPPPLPVFRVKGDGLRRRTIAEHPLARPRDEAHSVFHPGFPTFSETAIGLSRRRPNARPTVYPSRRPGGGPAAAKRPSTRAPPAPGPRAMGLAGEAELIDADLVRATCLTGTAEELVERLRTLEAEGLQELTFATGVDEKRRFAEEFSRLVMSRL